jgi:hypothetical protein
MKDEELRRMAAERETNADFAEDDARRERRGEPSPEARALARGVMAALRADPRSFRLRPIRSSPVRRRPAAVAALAACALLSIGFFWREATTQEVRFVLEAPGARSVFLAGDFSSWDPEGLPLRKASGDLWERTVRLRRGRSYSYNFIVDGTSWVVDPAAPERIDDGFGGESALIRL